MKTDNYKPSPFVHESLVELGFRKSSEHESAQDLYSISLKSGLELEISVITGKGRIFVHDDWDDVSMCDIPVQFETPAHAFWFISALTKPNQPVEFYKHGADADPLNAAAEACECADGLLDAANQLEKEASK